MIVQEFFFYDDKIFLTIVHENMDDEIKNRMYYFYHQSKLKQNSI